MAGTPSSTARARSTAPPAVPAARPGWAQWAATGKLAPGDEFVHESIIGSLFRCRVESATKVGNHDAIVPSIEGWARVTGLNTIFVDEADPFAHGFQVT